MRILVIMMIVMSTMSTSYGEVQDPMDNDRLKQIIARGCVVPHPLHVESEILLKQFIAGKASEEEFKRFSLPNSQYIRFLDCVLRAVAVAKQ